MQQQIKRSNVRYGILVFLFLATVFNYADRATLSVVAPIMSKELGFDPEAMARLFGVWYFLCYYANTRRLAAG